jgi:hypothetical protein
LLAQLRSSAEGNATAANLFSTVQGTMTPAEVDRFAMTLVSKLTNARVYSA